MSDNGNIRWRWQQPELGDNAFWCLLLDDVAWLFYGDLDEHFTKFVHFVFTNLEEEGRASPSFSSFGFPERYTLPPHFAVAYWLFLSELVRLDLAEYGSSPRSAWLTDDGQRFRRIFLAKFAENPDFDWREEWDEETCKASLYRVPRS